MTVPGSTPNKSLIATPLDVRGLAGAEVLESPVADNYSLMLVGIYYDLWDSTIFAGDVLIESGILPVTQFATDALVNFNNRLIAPVSSLTFRFSVSFSQIAPPDPFTGAITDRFGDYHNMDSAAGLGNFPSLPAAIFIQDPGIITLPTGNVVPDSVRGLDVLRTEADAPPLLDSQTRGLYNGGSFWSVQGKFTSATTFNHSYITISGVNHINASNPEYLFMARANGITIPAAGSITCLPLVFLRAD